MQQWNEKNENKGFVKMSWWSSHLYKYVLQYSPLENHTFQSENAGSPDNTVLEGIGVFPAQYWGKRSV